MRWFGQTKRKQQTNSCRLGRAGIFGGDGENYENVKCSGAQSLVVLVMLALQKGGLPVKSYLLSNRLEVSESYLKKTMRKLVVAGIVEAIEGDGSFIH